MYLRELNLQNFKNYASDRIRFENRFICFNGENGAGKTNLLDAIHYLCLGKSHFNPIDSQNIRHRETFFNIRGDFEFQGEDLEIFCAFMKGKRKVIKRNDVAYERLTDHVGSFPVVVVAPYDIKLISEGSEERRKFLDSMISQLDHEYLDNLVKYQRTLNQRNAQLKKMCEEENFNRNLIDVYDEILMPLGQAIFSKRNDFLNMFSGIFRKYYGWISNEKEEVNAVYQSQLQEHDFAELLRDSFTRDVYLQRTTTGIHKDDMVFTINGYPLKKFGSQGQQKSFLIALKLAQFDLIREHKRFPPLLLLDDIFDRLDENRVRQLIETIAGQEFSQVFITDTSRSRTLQVLEPFRDNLGIFAIEAGSAVNKWKHVDS